jgi:MarR family 2-MHQ and catechol resistance regulon transcriptional repressor
MKKDRPEAFHTWRLMLMASHSIYRYLLPPILQSGLGDSDYRVLDVLLYNGPMPVNAIGPRVYLNPGSVSVAVDRLYKKGLVSRVESESDRRVRTVSLTNKGRELFVPLFRHEASLIGKVFQDVSPGEREQLEGLLKRIGKRAELLSSEPNKQPSARRSRPDASFLARDS